MSDEQFDPSEHGVDEVNEYLKTADEEERTRVLAAEAADKNRSTVKAPASAAAESDTPEQSDDEKPEWDVSTHGPLRDDQRGQYRVVNG